MRKNANHHQQKGISSEDFPRRFIADCMLGTLAKRLRMLGYDTLYFNEISDDKLVRIANEEKRVILTRDSGLIKRKAAINHILIDSDDLDEQLRQVKSRAGITADNALILSRCVSCNTELRRAHKKEVIGKVPPFVFLKHSNFHYCRECDKYYWGGSHIDHLRRKLSGAESNDTNG